MFRDIRRKDREMGKEDTFSLLETNEYGFLATCGEDGWPYCIPVSYVYKDGFIYFHCAHTGQKLDNIAFNNKVCFSLAGETQPVYDINFTTYYKSVVVFGLVEEVSEEGAKREALLGLVEKYLPAHRDKAPESIEKSLKATAIYRIRAEHITGKEKKGQGHFADKVEKIKK